MSREQGPRVAGMRLSAQVVRMGLPNDEMLARHCLREAMP